jgi:hypothetical protein
MDCPPTATPQIVPAVWVPDFFWGASTPLQSFTTEAIDKYPGRLCGLLGQDQVGTERILLGANRCGVTMRPDRIRSRPHPHSKYV